MAHSSSDDNNFIGNLNDIHEEITVPDRDLSPSEMARIMRQIARCSNMVAGLIMRYAAINGSVHSVGAGAQITQSILACAAQADQAAILLEGPSRIATGPANMQMMPPRGGGRA